MTKFTIVALVIFLRTEVNIQAASMPHFCLAPLNSSDCGAPPAAVFTYYKPGSRCELELWRGCPTLNTFPAYAECAQLCVGRQWRVGDMVQDEVVPIIGEHEPYPVEDKKKYQNPNCFKELNTDACFQTSASVITYMPKDNHCVNVTWHGCPSQNIYTTVKQCEHMCVLSTSEAVRQDEEDYESINAKESNGDNDREKHRVREKGEQKGGIDILHKNDDNYDGDNGGEETNSKSNRDNGGGNSSKDDKNYHDDKGNDHITEADNAIDNGGHDEAPTEENKTSATSEPLNPNSDSAGTSYRSTDGRKASTIPERIKTTGDNEFQDVSADIDDNVLNTKVSRKTTALSIKRTTPKKRTIKIKNLRVYSRRKYGFDLEKGRPNLQKLFVV